MVRLLVRPQALRGGLGVLRQLAVHVASLAAPRGAPHALDEVLQLDDGFLEAEPVAAVFADALLFDGVLVAPGDDELEGGLELLDLVDGHGAVSVGARFGGAALGLDLLEFGSVE